MREEEIIMTLCDLAQTYFDAAMMARYTAQSYRRSAKQWPAHAREDGAKATECYKRALWYLEQARYFQANFDARKAKEHEHVAA